MARPVSSPHRQPARDGGQDLTLDAQRRVLEIAAADIPLKDCLDRLCLDLEAAISGATAAFIVLRDHKLILESSPSASAELRGAVEALEFPGWLDGTVIVTDTHDEPRWQRRIDLVDAQNVRACWSVPIFDTDGTVHGKLVVALDHSGAPGDQDLTILNACIYVAGMALVRDARNRDQRRMLAMLEATSDIVMMFTPEYRMTYTNDACSKLLNYGPNDALPDNVLDHFPSEIAERIQHDGIPCARRFGSWSAETIWLTNDGRRIPMLQVIAAHNDEKGEAEHFSTIARDVSQLKETELALRVSEERYRTLVENATEAILVMDVDRECFVDFNGRALRLFGFSAEEMMGLPQGRLLAASDASPQEQQAQEQITKRMIAETLAGKTPVFERFYKTADGRIIPCEVRLARMPSKTRRLVRGSIVDISDRHRAQRELRDSELRFSSMFNQSIAFVGIIGRDGAVVDLNQTVLRTTGQDKDGLIGTMIWSAPWWSQPAGDTTLENAVAMAADGRTSRSIVGYVDADGGHGWLDLSFKPIRDDDDRVVNVLFEGRDITERVSAEERLEDYAGRLQSLSGQLLRAQETERRQIAQELHDEIGQSLTVLRLGLHNLGSVDDDTQREVRVSHCEAAVDLLLDQVRSMSLNLRPPILDDLGLVAALRWYLNRHAENTAIDFDLDTPDDMPRLPQEIESTCFRIAQEALTNAMRHSGSEQISVRLRLDRDLVTLAVSDDGLGFDAAAEYDSAAGQSLGLLGMHERAVLVGGKLTIDSRAQQGTTILAEIPLTDRSDVKSTEQDRKS